MSAGSLDVGRGQRTPVSAAGPALRRPGSGQQQHGAPAPTAPARRLTRGAGRRQKRGNTAQSRTRAGTSLAPAARPAAPGAAPSPPSRRGAGPWALGAAAAAAAAGSAGRGAPESWRARPQRGARGPVPSGMVATRSPPLPGLGSVGNSGAAAGALKKPLKETSIVALDNCLVSTAAVPKLS